MIKPVYLFYFSYEIEVISNTFKENFAMKKRRCLFICPLNEIKSVI